MLLEVFINIKNNRIFYLRLIMLCVCIFSVISIFCTCMISYFESMELQQNKYAYSNFYNIKNIIDEQAVDVVFQGIEYEYFEVETRTYNATLSTKNNEYQNVRPYVSILEIDKQIEEFLPTNVIKSIKSYGRNICEFGRTPLNNNEICLPFDVFINLRNKNMQAITSDKLLNSIITLMDEDGNVILSNCKVVGVFSVGVFDLFDTEIVKMGSGINCDIKCDKKVISRVYVDKFESIEEITNRIVDSNNVDNIVYGGSQYGQYMMLKNYVDFAKSIYESIAFPLIITMLTSWIIMIMNYLLKQRKIFLQMKLVGYTNKQLILFTLNELMLCCVVALIVSAVIGFVCVLILKGILARLFISLTINTRVIFISLGILISILMLFCAVFSIVLTRLIVKKDLFTFSKNDFS